MKYASGVLILLILACNKEAEVQKPTPVENVAAPVKKIGPEDFPQQIDPALAARFASLAMNCMHQEYPNKVSRTIESDDELGPPRELFPVFYGCFDWHSAVHGHWLLVRLLRVGPKDGAWRTEAIVKLAQSFTEKNVLGELANFDRKQRGSWERPYGLAWFLQLTAELREWNDPQAQKWLSILSPLEARVVESVKQWLPKLAYPIRLGTHNQSAFAFTLFFDWAKIASDQEMTDLITKQSKAFHASDVSCPINYEPSGEDFLSPCLMEADLMRRILSPSAFSQWLTEFLPQIPKDEKTDWLKPGIVKDASDGKLVHLDGVNSSRAWNLYNIARALPEDDARRVALVAAAKVHQKLGVAAVSDSHYAGSHWLASFATYLMTDRGAPDALQK